MAAVHIIGAGVAGLACAVRLAGQGRRVRLYEAAPQAGGRCRSFFDRTLGCSVDNGNHLLLSGNGEAMGYLRAIGAEDRLTGPDEAAFPFFDVGTNRRYALRFGRGALPFWLLRRDRRIPDTRLWDYLAAARFAVAPASATVTDVVRSSHPLFRAFWQPLTVAAINAAPARAAASLLWAVLANSFARGAARSRPIWARASLSNTFVDPALAHLRRRGAEIQVGRRLRGLDRNENHVRRLLFSDGSAEEVGSDQVVLALPPAACRATLPDQAVPDDGDSILNLHFRVDERQQPIAVPGFVGLIGGTAHWAFVRPGLISVTVSAAGDDPNADLPDIAARIWREAATALHVPQQPVPAYRVVWEKRATFDPSPANLRRRSGPATPMRNLLLAGDWTDTGLPASIEGAVLSGHRAAELALRGPQ